MPARAQCPVECIGAPVHAHGVAFRPAVVGIAHRPQLFIAEGQQQFHFADGVARVELRGELLRGIGEAHEQATIERVEGQRPGAVRPDRLPAPVFHLGVDDSLRPVFGKHEWGIPLPAETAHAGGLRAGDFQRGVRPSGKRGEEQGEEEQDSDGWHGVTPEFKYLISLPNLHT